MHQPVDIAGLVDAQNIFKVNLFGWSEAGFRRMSVVDKSFADEFVLDARKNMGFAEWQVKAFAVNEWKRNHAVPAYRRKACKERSNGQPW